MQALWMLAAAFFFATMAVCVKFASVYFSSSEMVFYRGLIGIVFMWVLARNRGITLTTRYPGMHMWRSLVGVCALGSWFYAIAHLPLATAMTLNYMSSVWIAAFVVGGALLTGVLPVREKRVDERSEGPPRASSAPVPGARGSAADAVASVGASERSEGPPRASSAPLPGAGGSAADAVASVGASERSEGPPQASSAPLPGARGSAAHAVASVGAISQGPLVLTVMAGFAGVVMMLRPTIEQNQAFAGLVGLMGGLLAAFAYMQVMALARLGEPETRTVFYFALGSALAGALGMGVDGISDWHWLPALWLIPLGLLASLGQLCMTRAYSLAHTRSATLVVANLQYSGIVFGAAYSLVLFGDRIALLGWLGMLLIVASGIAATALRTRAAPNAPGEDH
jgi:S-adenosylmethionine uptake transporter